MESGSGLSDLKGIAAPARRALASAGIENLEDLQQIPQAELAQLHGMGPKALRILSEALTERGMSFKS